MLKFKQEDCCEGETHTDSVVPFEEQFGDSNDSGQGFWSELSKGVAANLSESVFSIASFNGIVIRCEPLITTLLTSASLLRSSHDESRIEDDLTIRVRYKYQQYINGCRGDYDLDYNLLLVNIKTPPLHVARLDHQVQLESCSKVLAVGRIFSSRKLMATSGLLKDAISIFDQEEISISTCKISKAGIGGPLIDVDGYFHGMNFYGVEETPFLPRSIILKCLRSFGMFQDENKGGDGYTSRKRRSTNSNLDASPYCGFSKELVDQMHDRLRSCNYPLPTTICAGMHLIHSFGEKFCKVDGSSGDFLNELSLELASKLSQNVVSLASFNGKTRCFACSGILVEYDLHTSVLTSASLVRSSDDENTIVDNLQIEVRLPNGQFVKGTLEYCNLELNIAVVNNMIFHDFRAANLHHPMEIETASEVVAVGRIFSSGRLTATRGIITDKKSNLDCDKLMVSTCIITKAGIGGALVDFSGNFIGMNFYDKEETPFIPRNDILECLRRFETRGIIAAENTVKHSPSRWPVPKPYWIYPTIEEPPDPLLELTLLPTGGAGHGSGAVVVATAT